MNDDATAAIVAAAVELVINEPCECTVTRIHDIHAAITIRFMCTIAPTIRHEVHCAALAAALGTYRYHAVSLHIL